MVKNIIISLIIIIIAIWVLVFAALLGIFPYITVKSPTEVIVAFGLGITIVCGILWVAHQFEIIKMSEKANTAIWTVLLASILGSSAAVYTTTIGTSGTSPIIDKLELIEVTKKDGQVSVTQKPNSQYVDENSEFAFFFAVRNLKTDFANRIDVNILINIEGPRGVAIFADRHITQGADEIAKSPLGQEVIKLFNINSETHVTFIYRVGQENDLGVGDGHLRVVLTDNNSRMTDQKSQFISLVEASDQ